MNKPNPAPVPQGTRLKMLAPGWQWDSEGEIIYVSRNLARDRNMFRVPAEGIKKKEQVIHNGEVQDVVTWQWPGDERIFLVPVELFCVARLGGLVRDVIAYIGQLFREQGFPSDLVVKMFLRQLAEGIGMAWAGGKSVQQLDDCLAYARFFTVRNQNIISELTKNGSIKRQEKKIFGFVDDAGRVTVSNCQPVPRNKQWYEVHISRLYAAALKTLPSAPLPVAALEAAHRAPWKLVTPVKNLAYHLAARVPTREVRLLLPTIRDILGFAERSDGKTSRTRRAVENVLNILYPSMVINYRYQDEGYNITLSGKPSKK